MPIVMQKKRLYMALFGTGVNDDFKYERHFQILPNGPDSKPALSSGYFETAMMMEPKPQTVAIVGADAEYAQNVLIGARANIEKLRLKIVYDRNYPPNTVDYLPIVRAIQATNPDIVFVASYPPDSVGMVRAINEAGFKPRMFGGGMIGLAFKAQRGHPLFLFQKQNRAARHDGTGDQHAGDIHRVHALGTGAAAGAGEALGPSDPDQVRIG
jgi:branched-chain amino acid transport system substrate-binding protein